MLINILHMPFDRFRPDANKQCNIVVILQHSGGITLRLRTSNGAKLTSDIIIRNNNLIYFNGFSTNESFKAFFRNSWIFCNTW